MIILVTGASHAGKTLLAQKLLERYHYPYLSIDHLKMGLIRSGHTDLTAMSPEAELTAYLWPIVREMVKTAIENGQNLIVEGCYIPFEWEKDFDEPYRRQIRCIRLIMSERYIRSHFEDIRTFANVIENRLDDSDCTPETVLEENLYQLAQCEALGLEYVYIDERYDPETFCPCLETQRLRLRKMTGDDFEALYRVLGDADIMRYYPYPFDEKLVRRWIEKNIERYCIFGFGLWAVCLKDTGEMIGDCGLTMQNINGTICPEIGYHIRGDMQRKGYASEAARAVRDWAFANTPFESVFSYMKKENIASRATAESIGMSLKYEYTDAENETVSVCGISRVEWTRFPELRFVRLTEKPFLKEQAAEWFHEKWGIPTQAYLDCMEECILGKTPFDWFLCLKEGRIVGGLGVIENDFHDRKDLAPNVCAVYTEPDFRRRGIAGRLLKLAVTSMREKGISPLYLLSDHTGFYERYGWEFLCMAQGDGEEEPSRMYVHR